MIRIIYRRQITAWILITLAVAQTGWSAFGQEAAVSGDRGKNGQMLSPEAVEQKIEALKARIESSQAAETPQTAEQLDVSADKLRTRTRRLIATQSVYQSIRAAMTRKETLLQEENDLNREIRILAQNGFPEPPPYSLSFYDSLLDRLTAATQERDNYKEAIDIARRSLEDARQKAEEARKTWRKIRETAEAGAPEAPGRPENWDLLSAALDKEWAEAIWAFERANLENTEIRMRIQALRIRLFQMPLDWVRKEVRFNEADLRKQRDRVRAEKTALRERYQSVMAQQKESEEAWHMASWKIFSSLDLQMASIHEAERRAYEAWRATYQTIQDQLLRRIRLLDREEEIWQYRYLLVRNGEPPDEVFQWEAAAREFLEKTEREIRLQQGYQGNLHLQISALEKQIEEEMPPLKIRRHLRNRMFALLELQQERLDYMEALSDAALMEKKLLNEIELRYDRISAREIWSDLKTRLKASWNYEIWQFDERPLTVRKLVVGLAILMAGIFIVRFLTRMICTRIFPERFRHDGTAALFEKMFTYFAYVMVVLLALRIVNFPLEAFAFLGGALAIGVGFGAQNLFNNFLSWFIMMAEGTINVGDLVEIDGVLGQIEDVSGRRTRIRTGENIDILVPNSSFLEKNVTNWTQTDRRIRTHVTVGVAYGTSPEQVEPLLLKVADANRQVLKTPAPFVIFKDFGDSALIFEVHFWIHVERILDRRIAQSRIRFQISRRFGEAGIVIAFPQRDLHIRSVEQTVLSGFSGVRNKSHEADRGLTPKADDISGQDTEPV